MTHGRANDDRRIPTDAEMRVVTAEIRRLLSTLEDPRGTLLDPSAVAEQLAAVRLRRVRVIPAAEPQIVQEECDDWSNLDAVPVGALGLRKSIYDVLVDRHALTVGIVVAHSKKGLGASGIHLGPKLMPLLEAALDRRNLQLAPDNSRIPISFVLKMGGNYGIYPWWSTAEQESFARVLDMKVLGDLSRLTRKKIVKAPFGNHRTSEPNPIVRSMSAENAQDVTDVITRINMLLGRYALPVILNNPLCAPPVRAGAGGDHESKGTTQ